MAGQLRHLVIFLALAVAGTTSATLIQGCGREVPSSNKGEPSASPGTTASPVTPSSAPQRGGQLVVSVRTEPQTFNRYTRRDWPTDLISLLTNAKLTRINRVTQEVEPWLAERWTTSPDGRTYTVTLRPDVTFSDGHPFTAADVVFSFKAVYDARQGSVLGDSLTVSGRPLAVTARDPRTVEIRFPEPFAPGLRLLDNLPILPEHKLGPALARGAFATAWNLDTPPADLAGLGPFVIERYIPGQRTILVRNPRYFRTDAAGVQLPYLDRVVVEVVPDQNAELLRLESGDLDLTTAEVRPEDYAPLKRLAEAGRVTLLDLGVAYDADSFWFNLTPGAFAGDPRAGWIQREELRHAVSLAVDRTRFADTVYLGAGVPVFGPVTPSNTKWFSPAVP
ncbi:MAG: ABC transporter substrate-binding protein, partial [Phycisphaerales bacterium]